ncbi:ribulose-phosphate 3-epimerase [Dellaglioa sp. L3N]
MSKKILCPSMMCADFTKLTSEVNSLEDSGIDIFHMDIMDGSFVSNMALGIQDFKAIRSLTSKKIDAHLMVQNPKNFINLFADLGADIIYIHPEADQIPTATIKQITDLGVSPGIAINPGTSLSSIEPLLSMVDYVLIMTVNPGFAGQTYIDFVDDKLRELIKSKNKYGYKLIVDGAISPIKVQNLSDLGVDGFVLGTSALFDKQDSYSAIVNQLQNDNIPAV